MNQLPHWAHQERPMKRTPSKRLSNITPASEHRTTHIRANARSAPPAAKLRRLAPKLVFHSPIKRTACTQRTLWPTIRTHRQDAVAELHAVTLMMSMSTSILMGHQFWLLTSCSNAQEALSCMQLSNPSLIRTITTTATTAKLAGIAVGRLADPAVCMERQL